MPDIILMDIMLKGEMGWTRAAMPSERRPTSREVIFLTAYADESTLAKATVTQPYGYIIKPFKEIDIHVDRDGLYKHKKETEVLKERDLLYSLVENKEAGGRDIMFVKSNSRLVKLKTSDIYFIEALKDYVVINTLNTRYTVHSTMKDIEAKLPEADFIRVHRSFIVRLDKVVAIEQPNLIAENDRK